VGLVDIRRQPTGIQEKQQEDQSDFQDCEPFLTGLCGLDCRVLQFSIPDFVANIFAKRFGARPA
jgi:hypothetical protein